MSSQQGILGTIRPSADIVEETDMGDIEYLARIANGELTSGVLKNFTSVANTTEVFATVPGGKDWYLSEWSVIASGAANGQLDFEYPTGTKVDGAPAGTTATKFAYNGVAKGLKLTAAQTVTITRTGTAFGNEVNMQIIEVDTGVSPTLT